MKKTTPLLVIGTLAAVLATEPVRSQSLFKDLTIGTETVSSPSGTAQAGSYPENFTNVGSSTMYFGGKDRVTGSPNLGMQVFKTDGTPAGTSMLKVLGSNTALGNLVFGFFDFNGITVFVNKSNGPFVELWRTDGTSAGTTLLKSFSTSSNNNNFPQGFCVAGTTLFFSADNGHGNELWKSDGTAAGTMEVIDLWPGAGPSPIGQYPGMFLSGGKTRLTTYNNKVYFWGNNGTNSGLYESDGTAAGTVFVKTITTPGQEFFKIFNSQLFFNDGSGNLWKSDGTAVGTVTTGITGVSSVIIFNNDLYVSGYKLYKTDGTAAGTQTLLNTAGDIYGGNTNAFYMRDYSTIPPKFYKSDGTAAGSSTVNWRVGAAASFQVINNKMYATHSDSGVVQSYNNSFLWETDGTYANTTKLISFNAGVHAFTGQLFYQNYDATHGNEPWVYTVGTGTTTNPPPPATVTAIGTNVQEQGSITLFPNPAHGKLTVYVSGKDNVNGLDLHILNALGSEVKQVSLNANETVLDIAELPAGIYFYSVKNKSTAIKTGKLVIN